MYIGQIEATLSDTWVFNEELNTMQRKHVTFSPALIKVRLFKFSLLFVFDICVVLELLVCCRYSTRSWSMLLTTAKEKKL